MSDKDRMLICYLLLKTETVFQLPTYLAIIIIVSEVELMINQKRQQEVYH